MKVFFRKSFSDDLASINDASLLRRIKNVIGEVEAAKAFQQINNLKRLQRQGKYYRIRIGDFRLGFILKITQ